MMHDTSQITTILLRALLAVLLNISGWQMAYQRSWAMQLRVRTDTETEMVCDKKKKKRERKLVSELVFSERRKKIPHTVASCIIQLQVGHTRHYFKK